MFHYLRIHYHKLIDVLCTNCFIKVPLSIITKQSHYDYTHVMSSIYACMYICMYVLVYVCVCMYVCMYVHTHIWLALPKPTTYAYNSKEWLSSPIDSYINKLITTTPLQRVLICFFWGLFLRPVECPWVLESPLNTSGWFVQTPTS